MLIYPVIFPFMSKNILIWNLISLSPGILLLYHNFYRRNGCGLVTSGKHYAKSYLKRGTNH